MSELEKIKVLASLDGYGFWRDTPTSAYVLVKEGMNPTMGPNACINLSDAPDYPHSYDAIIPCVNRLGLWRKMVLGFPDKAPTPSQICDFVLLEAGKFEL